MTRLNTTRVIVKSFTGVFILFLALTPAAVWAQGEASISGVVTITRPAPRISGATVNVKNVETGSKPGAGHGLRGPLRRHLAHRGKIRSDGGANRL